jgi:type II secretory pathway component PulF
VFVIPNFMPLFEQLGGELPLITQIVLAVGNFVSGYWWLLLVLLVGGDVPVPTAIE